MKSRYFLTIFDYFGYFWLFLTIFGKCLTQSGIFSIDGLMMEPCCALKYNPEMETCVNEKQIGQSRDKLPAFR
jgi:hypothetical protein